MSKMILSNMALFSMPFREEEAEEEDEHVIGPTHHQGYGETLSRRLHRHPSRMSVRRRSRVSSSVSLEVPHLLLLLLLLVLQLRGELWLSPTTTTSTTSSIRRSSFLFAESSTLPQGEVELEERENTVVLRNGLVNVTFYVPFGFIISVEYAGFDNLLFTNQTMPEIPWGGAGGNINNANNTTNSTSGLNGGEAILDLGDPTVGVDDHFQPRDLFDSVHDSLPCYDGDYCYDPTVASTYYASENASSQAQVTARNGEPSKRAAWDMTWAREKLDERGLYNIEKNNFQRLFGTTYRVIYPSPPSPSSSSSSSSSYSSFSIYSSDHNSSSSSSSSSFTNSSSSRFLRSPDRIEISFSTVLNWTLDGPVSGNGSAAANASQGSRRRSREAPINFDIRYVMEKGKAGVYTYLVMDHPSEYDNMLIVELRMVVRLRPDLFRYAAIDNDRHRIMPSALDMVDQRSRPMMLVETRLLTDPINPAFLNEIDHKYHYTTDSKDTSVLGWVSDRVGEKNDVGVWWITPHRTEWMGGGPMKQDLTVHTGPSMLLMVHSLHFGTRPVSIEAGEAWRKVYGPCLLYFNERPSSGSGRGEGSDGAHELWKEAVAQATVENASWPYTWMNNSGDYPPRSGRGSVMGRLVVVDPFEPSLSGAGGWIGLVDAGSAEPGGFHNEVKRYQYWVRAGEKGAFRIKQVRPGSFRLHAYVPGVYGQYVSENVVIVRAGRTTMMGSVFFRVPRSGPTLWEIGIPDRSAAEFFVPVLNPDSQWPYPPVGENRFRNYGSWLRYAERFNYSMGEQLVYTTGVSHHSKDWWYVQPVMFMPEKSPVMYAQSTWRVDFDLWNDPDPYGEYVFRASLAASHNASVLVRVNNATSDPLVDTELDFPLATGNDNAMARASAHGDYGEFFVKIPGSLFQVGTNSIFLTQKYGARPLSHLMWDYLRLETPAPGSSLGRTGGGGGGR